jgi:succinyl-CoA synthetase beta subunit/citryl-CoA synthetase large subunit
MLTLTEEAAKAWLRDRGLPVPRGIAVATAADAADAARALADGAVVKALVPTGRRGKAGAVRLAMQPDAAAEAAAAMLGQEILGHPVSRVYVEERVAIARELYLSFILDGPAPKVLASLQGGVDIEAVHRETPEAIAEFAIDPLDGLRPWQALELWNRAGLNGAALPAVARLTKLLYEAFHAADATLLELNPIALDAEGRPLLVGAMMGIDESALPRQPQWAGLDDGSLIAAWRRFNERELAVAEVNRTVKGGAIRYTELDGDIGFVVGGGGAGLLQHDIMLSMGGRPANHTDTNPGQGTKAKLRAVFRAVLDNPRTKGMLVSFNHQQLARCDAKAEPLMDVLRERQVDPRRYPIVVRLLGPGEAEARAMTAEIPGITYMPSGTTLDDAVLRIVELTRDISR